MYKSWEDGIEDILVKEGKTRKRKSHKIQKYQFFIVRVIGSVKIKILILKTSN